MMVRPFLLDKEFKVRKENEDYYFLIPPAIGKYHFVNKTYSELIEMSDGETTLNEILETYYTKYPNVAKNKIYTDIIDSFYYLQLLKLIDFKDGCLPSIEDPNIIRPLRLQEFVNIENHISTFLDSGRIKFMDMTSIIHYNNYFSWIRHNSADELFMGYCDPECKAILSILPLPYIVYIGIFCAADIDKGIALHEETVNHLKEKKVKYIKAKIEKGSMYKENSELFRRLCYIPEAILVGESPNENDIEIWVRHLE